MEMFGNPITGYTTEFYSMMIESQVKGESGKKYVLLIKKEDLTEKNTKNNLYKRMQNK
jgi:hypothetical protein